MRILLIILFFNSFCLNGQNPFEKLSIFKTNLNDETSNEWQDALYQDGLIITANYKKSEDSLVTGGPLYRSYYCEGYDRTTFSDPQLIKFVTNEYSLDQASFITLDNQGNSVFCASDNRNNSDRIYISLFQGKFEKKSIHSIDKIDLGMEGVNCAQPTLSLDGKSLFFVSGDNLDLNIYFSEKNENEWSIPIPLKEINSEFQEFSPIFINDTTIVFSSNRPGGFGGLDLYYSVKSKKGWSKPINLGVNINSAKDEFRLIIDSNFSYGYLTSNKSGTDDIYLIRK